ncbi:hypothetical protein BC829DRAFT_492702 [Chytridium lagenaria]|nr:hypothetical protein BC829DRAFT_492702 [Chytridium lagenaria]
MGARLATLRASKIQSCVLDERSVKLMNPPAIPPPMESVAALDPVTNIISSKNLQEVTPPAFKRVKRFAGSTKVKKTTATPTSSDSPLNVVVAFKFKDFQGNRTKPTARETISLESFESFYLRVWDRVKVHIKRLVKMPKETDGVMEWDARTEYTVADLSEFVTFSDDKGHRRFPEGVLPPYGDLLPFRAVADGPLSAEQKTLTIHAHAYGNVVVKKSQYNELGKRC